MKMIKVVILTIAISAFHVSCKVKSKLHTEAYSWVCFETIPRDSVGKVNGNPYWGKILRIHLPVNTFEIYGNYDSIRMITSDVPEGHMFRKIPTPGSRWKPKPEYGNQLFFLATYEREQLPGFYFSFYVDKDWNNLMQVLYTNPGNMMDALLFTKDSMNILKGKGIIIDPRDEQSEPENIHGQLH